MVDEGAIDELYGLPLDEFIPARTRLAKELRSAGDREGAARVQALRKPTVAAWAVNQLARQEQKRLDELFASVEALRSAQEKALKGEGARVLQEAGARRRSVVDRLAESAARVLEQAGHGAGRSNLDGVTNTLLAVATEPEAANLVRAGRLEKEFPPPSGFGELNEMAVVLPMPARRKPPKAETRAEPAPVKSAAEARAERRAHELARDAEAAEQEAARLRDEADRADVEIRRLREELSQAERAAARADRAAQRAERKAVELRERADRAASRAE